MGEDGTRVILRWQKVGRGSKTGICRLINGGRAPDPVCGVGLATKDRLEAGPSTCQRSVCMNSPTRIRRILLVSPMQPSTAPGTRGECEGGKDPPPGRTKGKTGCKQFTRKSESRINRGGVWSVVCIGGALVVVVGAAAPGKQREKGGRPRAKWEGGWSHAVTPTVDAAAH
jgi:hypothetical protein